MNFWTEQLDSGRRSRGWVMIGFSESPEYKRTAQPTVDLVQAYTGMLRRVPTPDERELWLPILSGGAPRTRVIAHLLSTAEYDERIPS